MKGLIEGMMVHYILNSGEHRPAMVVKVWDDLPQGNGCCNLLVFMDADARVGNDPVGPVMRVTSIIYDETRHRGTWHWPEKKMAMAVA